jgi:hypothetical protein
MVEEGMVCSRIPIRLDPRLPRYIVVTPTGFSPELCLNTFFFLSPSERKQMEQLDILRCHELLEISFVFNRANQRTAF